MSTTVSTTNLPANVPKLDPTGSNWVIYRIRFTCAIQSKGVFGHLDGSDICPQSPSGTVSIAPVMVVQGPATAAGVAPQMAAPQTTAPDPAAVTAYEEVLAKLLQFSLLCTISQHPYLLFLSLRITPITTDF